MDTKDLVELRSAERFGKSEVGEAVVLEDPLAGTGNGSATAVRVYGKHQVLERCEQTSEQRRKSDALHIMKA